MGDPLLIERDGWVTTVTLNRPDAANSLNRATLEALNRAVKTLSTDDVRAVIFTGSGEKAFCAGADLKERAGMGGDEVRAFIETIRETLTQIARLPQATIAAVNGHALGGGTELALACDIRIASAAATMGLTETTLAIIPGGGGTQRLPRLVGPGRAKEMILTGRRVGAEEAARIGLVEETVAGGELLSRAREIAERIASNGPIAVRASKEAIDRGLELPIDEALRLESRLYERTIETEDRIEGLAAFREKRAPSYKGR